MKRLIVALLFALLAFPAFAAPQYALVKEQSSLKFVAIQNNAPIEGQFKHFDAQIAFDAEKLTESSITVTVDTGSVAASYGEVADELKKPEWLDAVQFPNAVFKSTNITAQVTSFQGGKPTAFVAEGELTLRDKTLPITLTFQFEKLDDKEAIATGKATIQRTAFGVGQGEWKDTGAVKDNVAIDFRVVAAKR